MFRGVPGTYRVTGRGSGHPRQKIWALWAKRWTDQPLSGWCAPCRPSWGGGRKGGREKEGEAKSSPLSFPTWPAAMGGAPAPCGLVCFLLMAHKAHNFSRGVPVPSRYSGKIRISPGTLLMSKHRLPIYQSLCLDHFETPRHVRDHIRDSEQPSVHQNA